MHFVRLREGNLGSRKQMIQKDTVVFQLEQDTRTVHLQKVFRRILARQIEPLNNLHAQRHVGKEQFCNRQEVDKTPANGDNE